MEPQSILSQLNFVAQCKKHGLSLWQCPQFLFIVLGIIIISAILVSFAVGSKYIEDPFIVALIVILVAVVLFIISVFITRSFETLAEANRMKSEFVSIVSHQLRAPLSNLKWTIEILMSGRVTRVDEKQIEYFKLIKENNDRMRELVSDLLIVSRIEQGRLPLQKAEISLKDLVQDLVEGVGIFARASNVEIELQVPKSLPKVSTDPSQIKLIIANLLDNSIRYIKDRGKVVVKLEKREGNVYFEVKDDGVGIPKKDRKYIFQKFFRSANVLKYQTEGTGLGLYIVKSIIERLGGKVGFESLEGSGSTFWFTLPLTKQ